MTRTLIALFLIFLVNGHAAFSAPLPRTTGSVSPEAALESIAPDDLAAIQARLLQSAEKTLPSVVGLRVNRSVVGSGVVVSADGLVLTAGHVTSHADLEVEFLFPDGKRARGKTLGVCKWADAGMAKITDPGQWPHSPMAKKDSFAIDDWVFAYGHPLGLIVNRPPPLRLGRILQLQPDTIHTDCCIVIGDSGGPLFNLAGEVIGINSRVPGIDSRPDLTYHVSINAFWDQYDRLLAGEVWENDSKGRYDTPLDGQLHTSVDGILPLTVRVQSAPSAPQNRNRGGNQRRQPQRPQQFDDLALGMIVDSDGHVVTKASETADRSDLVCVIRANGREERRPARVVAVDRRNDFALLKIENPGFSAEEKATLDRLLADIFPKPPAEEASTDAATAAETADTPDTPEVPAVSIGTLVVTPVPGGDIPAILGTVSIVKRSIPSEILSIGVSLDGSGSTFGARVLQTLPRSSAAAAGLRQNDVITKINETDVENHATLAEFFEKVKPGDRLELMVRRGSETISVTVSATDAAEQAARRNAMNRGGPFGISRVHDGFPDIMQHDSVVRPSDCGGPLVTLDGRLIGVNIARAGRTETYAVPLAKFRQIVEELRTQ